MGFTKFPNGVEGPIKLAVESLITTKSLLESDSGKTFILNLAGGFTVTLPTVAAAGAGWNCRFIVGINPTTAYIITEDASEDTNVIIGGFCERETDTGDDGPVTTGATFITFTAAAADEGDWVDVICDGTNFYHLRTN